MLFKHVTDDYRELVLSEVAACQNLGYAILSRAEDVWRLDLWSVLGSSDDKSYGPPTSVRRFAQKLRTSTSRNQPIIGQPIIGNAWELTFNDGSSEVVVGNHHMGSSPGTERARFGMFLMNDDGGTISSFNRNVNEATAKRLRAGIDDR